MSNQPNLLYVFADQLRWASLGYNGDSRARTPNIDALRTESMDLCNAVSGHPVCAPYRASLFTGKYTTSTGMVINEIRMNPDHRSFAHVLDDAGYETCYIGKWHLYANQWGNHEDVKNSFIPRGPDRLGFDDTFAAYNFHHEYYAPHAYYHTETPEKIFTAGYEPDDQTDLAISHLERLSAGEKPFAMFLSIGTPHDPWVPENVPPAYLERFRETDFPLPPNYLPDNDPHADDWARLSPEERRQLPDWMRVYYAMVANLDDNLGRLLRAVDDLGLRENTVLVFTSDHGELFGAHGRRAKNIFYDEAARVPFLVRWQGHIAPDTTSDVCINTVDLMPTLLSLLGLECPPEVEGQDCAGALLGRPFDQPDCALLMGTGATACWEDGHEWRAVRDKQYTYAVFRSDGQELLFDNLADPYQMHNLAEDPAFAAVKADLQHKMQAKMARIGDDFAPSSFYQQHWVRNRLILKTYTLHPEAQLPPFDPSEG